MRLQTFNEILAASGSDRPTTPMMSRDERLRESVPRPVLEALERRRFFAVNVVAGVLVVTGTSGNDQIDVWKDNSSTDVYVDMNGSRFGPYTAAQISANKVKVVGAAGDDQLNLWNSGGGFDLQYPGEVYGDDGDDFIEGSKLGSFGDTIYGGYGYDIIEASDGPDSVYAGYDDDSIDGGPGNDYIRGEDGSDTITGGDGADQMFGDNGDDWFHASDHTIDTLNGGAGVDCAGIDKDTTVPTVDVLQFMEG
jgi:Ca2+-binding RTX toxin-like protein